MDEREQQIFWSAADISLHFLRKHIESSKVQESTQNSGAYFEI
jgi:hypothetical protein